MFIYIFKCIFIMDGSVKMGQSNNLLGLQLLFSKPIAFGWFQRSGFLYVLLIME